MNRFKTSKYRNAFSRPFKKENWIHDLNVGSNLKSNTCGIKASCQYIAFIHNSSSVGSLAVVPIHSTGRNLYFPTVSGHSGLVTDFEFSPFNDCMLATGSEDGLVKLWQLPEDSNTLTVDYTVPYTTQLTHSGSIEGVHFNPVADNLLASSVNNTVLLWDLSTQQERYVSSHSNGTVIQNFAWNSSGSLISTISKTEKHKHIAIIDPRSDTLVAETTAHSQTKDSSITWLGDHLVTTGYTSSSEAELMLWDSTNMTKPLVKYSLGRGAGIPLTFYDEDTSMLFVAVKGETTISFYEQLSDHSLSIAPNGYRDTVPQKGVGMIPKRAVDVMSGEINRLLILTQSAIVPVGFHVQRRSYTEFHSDLYPDTAGPLPAMSVDEWFDRTSTAVRGKVSLDPSSKVTVREPSKREESTVAGLQKEVVQDKKDTEQVDSAPTSKVTKSFNIVRSSKVRYIEGYMQHKSTYLEKIPSLNKAIPVDSDGFTVNQYRVGVALSGAGNRIAIFELDRPGRVDANEIYTVQNVTSVMDFSFDPFDPCRLVVACDDSVIKVWDIPDKGLTQSLTAPSFTLSGHYDKPNVIQFHPIAKDILATSGSDGSLYIWNMKTGNIEMTLETDTQSVYAMNWSPDGISLITVSRDQMIRLYKPRESLSPIMTGNGPVSSRGGRVVWFDNNYFIVSGFNKEGNRELSLYNVSSITAPISSLKFDNSPSPFKLHYDPDIHILYLTGKGDSTIRTLEFSLAEKPYIFETAPYSGHSTHQDVKFLPKIVCNVKKVEVGQAVRLCSSVIELIGFKIPRVKMEYFQDDIYCDTSVTWQSVQTASDWLQGHNCCLATVSLKPEGMKLLSEAPKPSASSVAPKYSSNVLREKTDEEKKEELIISMMSKMNDKEDQPLPQDEMDGVDSDEWDD